MSKRKNLGRFFHGERHPRPMGITIIIIIFRHLAVLKESSESKPRDKKVSIKNLGVVFFLWVTLKGAREGSSQSELLPAKEKVNIF